MGAAPHSAAVAAMVNHALRRRASVGAGLVAFAAATSLFAVVAFAALTGQSTMAGLDAYATEFLARHSSPPIEAIMGVVSAWHAPGGIVTLTALAALVLLWRRDGLGLLMLLSSVLGGATLNHMLKHGFQRPRPGMEHLPAAVTDFAFPSGHAANATLLYGACVVLLVPHLSARWARAAAVFGALLWVGLVSGSRVLLGAHRLSDVLGGMLLGLAWLALCMAATAALERIKAGR